MDKGTGTIIVAKPLDAEQKSSYNLTVEVTDGTTSIVTQVSLGICWRMNDFSDLKITMNTWYYWIFSVGFTHQPKTYGKKALPPP